jgi:hypothetical protein
MAHRRQEALDYPAQGGRGDVSERRSRPRSRATSSMNLATVAAVDWQARND